MQKGTSEYKKNQQPKQQCKVALGAIVFFLISFPLLSNAQEDQTKDQMPVKIEHAEPLYIDLIRDLGAHQGEKEWNVGFGITDKTTIDEYEFLVEYEFAAADRLGFEVEIPFLFYSAANDGSEVPSAKAESIKLATQWSFFVHEKVGVSMALGYINEFVLTDFDSFSQPFFTGNIYNPFLVIAKKWHNNLHALVYTGPSFEQHYQGPWTNSYEVNTSIHYMIPATNNFVGIEFNKYWLEGDFDMVIRPQMRLLIHNDLLLGIVTGIPISKEKERLSMFLRLIWEPKSGVH